MFGDHRANRERFFRGSRRSESFNKGDLKYIILDLIQDRPRHGYDIIRDLEEQSYGLYKPSPGVVYPTLQMLEDMGYATVTEEEGKKVYAITREGRAFLAEKSNIADGVRKRARDKWSFKRIGDMVNVMKEYHNLENLLGRNMRSWDTDKAERIRQILIDAYQAIEDVIQE
jgi:DNA-binding PadR family transcriptional regulator